MDQPFILGVNYLPRKKAMYWWSDFAAKNPMVAPALRKVNLPYTGSEYYHDTLIKFIELYEVWKAGG